MKEIIPILLAILAGIFTTLEAGINGKLGRIVSPKIATLHSLITGVIIILIGNLLKGSLHQYAKIIRVRPHLLIGGIFGTFIIYFITRIIPKLGVANTLTIIVASQVISGLLIDIYVTKQQELDWSKLIGLILLLCGTYFIMKK